MTTYTSDCVHCGTTITHLIGQDDDEVCPFCRGDFCTDACRKIHTPRCALQNGAVTNVRPAPRKRPD